MELVVIGAGVVGGATLEVLSEHHRVQAIDVQEKRVNDLQQRGFHASLLSEMNLEGAEVIFVSVPTPTQEGGCQRYYLSSAVTSIAWELKRIFRDNRDPAWFPVIAVRSTILPYTMERIVIPCLTQIIGEAPGSRYGVVYHPEFLQEDIAVESYRSSPLIIVGANTEDERSVQVMRSVYKDFGGKFVLVEMVVAEVTKYVHNLFNAVRIAFYNEMRRSLGDLEISSGSIQAAFELSVTTIAGLGEGHGTRDRGPFGGSCLPKDLSALTDLFNSNGIFVPLLEAAWRSNLAEIERWEVL